MSDRMLSVAIVAAFAAIPMGPALAIWTGNNWWCATLFILCAFL